MFLGEYQYKVDEKGRIPLPPRFKERLKMGLVLAKGLEKCITVYPVEEWTKVGEKLATLPPIPSKTRRINRFTFATAFYEDLDPQGRIALPSALRCHAEIKQNAVVAGVNNYLEIWSKESWEKENQQMMGEAWQISEGTEEHNE
jgi:MraZ protein